MVWLRLSNAFKRVFPVRLGLTPADKLLAQKTANQKVTEIVGQLQIGRFAEVRKHFTPVLQWMITESVLRKGWQVLCLAAGPVVKVGTPLVNFGRMTTAKVPIQFQRAKIGMVLQINSSGRLIGLRFGPQSNVGLGPSWTAPAYADVASFKEQSVRVGERWYTVGGTLTVPNTTGPHPCVILLAGSGPVDRDSTCGAAKPFKDLAWGLASRGVAVLRFDKVTYVYGAKFRSNESITMTDEYVNHGTDALHQLQQRPEIAGSQIFVLGHSLGAWIAPRIAANNPSVAGLAIMAGPAQAMYWSAIRQLRYLASVENRSDQDTESILKKLRCEAILADSPSLDLSTPVDKLPFGIGAPYWLDARTFEPIITTNGLQKPVIVLQGGRDYQVTVKDDYSEWIAGLEGRNDIEFHVYDKLNHLFVAGEGPPTAAEYELPGNVEEDVIRNLSDWILSNSGQ